jgi:hypothetical protein
MCGGERGGAGCDQTSAVEGRRGTGVERRSQNQGSLGPGEVPLPAVCPWVRASRGCTRTAHGPDRRARDCCWARCGGRFLGCPRPALREPRRSCPRARVGVGSRSGAWWRGRPGRVVGYGVRAELVVAYNLRQLQRFPSDRVFEHYAGEFGRPSSGSGPVSTFGNYEKSPPSSFQVDRDSASRSLSPESAASSAVSSLSRR